ncbi:MAG: hypothetical protein H7Z40_13505 [Phycisphaerae bacterium]|nr:hypothetical protein [Gemmatimonadaceae bacterium]
MKIGRICSLAAACLVTLAACGTQDAAMRKLNGLSDVASADSMGPLPTNVVRIPTDEPKDLVESSSIVMSETQPGIVFTTNDSGSDPVLFALDTTGATRGRWEVGNATNRDWEAASRGPCIRTDSATTTQPASCLYVGDVGDNSARRKAVTLYQLVEPSVRQDMSVGVLQARALYVRYPDAPHDVEAMYVGPEGTLYLITKRALKDKSGALRPALVFSVPATAWMRLDTTVGTLLDSLPIVPGSADQRQITDASLAHDSQYLAVRTYGQVFTFATDSATGRVRHDIPPAPCNIVATEAKHGEGITWFAGSRELLLSNEGRNAPLHRITCPLPPR